MFVSPFAFIVLDGDLNAPQDFLADGADRRSKGIDERLRVEVKDILEVNMLKTLPRLHSAPCHEGIGYA